MLCLAPTPDTLTITSDKTEASVGESITATCVTVSGCQPEVVVDDTNGVERYREIGSVTWVAVQAEFPYTGHCELSGTVGTPTVTITEKNGRPTSELMNIVYSI